MENHDFLLHKKFQFEREIFSFQPKTHEGRKTENIN